MNYNIKSKKQIWSNNDLSPSTCKLHQYRNFQSRAKVQSIGAVHWTDLGARCIAADVTDGSKMNREGVNFVTRFVRISKLVPYLP